MTTKPKRDWLLAVSGGPDSMATLHMNLERALCVCHVNYNARPTSLDDQLLVKRFCEQNDLPLFVLQAKHAPGDGNFQNWARQVRYDYFVEVAKKQGCATIVTGHTADDFLETAVMQSYRGGFRLYFGIKEHSSFKGLPVYRPSLGLTKDDLLAYLAQTKISFAVDQTNFQNDYKRNLVRQQLSRMPKEERRLLYESYVNLNKVFAGLREKAEQFFSGWSSSGYAVKYFVQEIPENLQVHVLYELLERMGFAHRSSGKIELLVKFIKKGRGGGSLRLGEGIYAHKRNALLSFEKNATL